jgi:hypothetical protein
MKRKVLVTIDVDGRLCGDKCPYLLAAAWCGLFVKEPDDPISLFEDLKTRSLKRCRRCLAAEKRAKL